jgi:hypothetical protein
MNKKNVQYFYTEISRNRDVTKEKYVGVSRKKGGRGR